VRPDRPGTSFQTLCFAVVAADARLNRRETGEQHSGMPLIYLVQQGDKERIPR
jgi:hypothetical protein